MQCLINLVGYTIYAENNAIFLVSKEKDIYSPILIDPCTNGNNIEQSCISIFELPVGYIIPRIDSFYYDAVDKVFYLNYLVQLPILWKKEGFFWVKLKDNTNNKLLSSIKSYK